MIGWLFDRIWAHRNRAELQQLGAQMDYLSAEGERLEKRMVEEFGPNWREEAERRLSKYLSGRYTLE